MKSNRKRTNEFALRYNPYSPLCEEYVKLYIDIAAEPESAVREKQLPKLESLLEKNGGGVEIIGTWWSTDEFMDFLVR